MARQAAGRSEKTHTMMSMAPMSDDPILSLGRHEMIAREAYLRAEQRGFQGGDPMIDWLEAEEEVDRMLNMNL